ncbi:ATP-binding cassette domain-containing protein, partial [candidate division WOR-3 bacterium]|nr:ATP-binding cassette domain-containing protein [candidate division WOR-3 bacterium]
MTNAVALRNVSASYSRHVALRDATLDVGRGDFLGILGPNGAGKTTLVTVINGLTRVSAGEVSL